MLTNPIRNYCAFFILVSFILQVYVGMRPKKKKKVAAEVVNCDTSYGTASESEEEPQPACEIFNGEVAEDDVVVLDPSVYPDEFPVIAKVSSCDSIFHQFGREIIILPAKPGNWVEGSKSFYWPINSVQGHRNYLQLCGCYAGCIT